jgi:hypothetical protein
MLPRELSSKSAGVSLRLSQIHYTNESVHYAAAREAEQLDTFRESCADAREEFSVVT